MLNDIPARLKSEQLQPLRERFVAASEVLVRRLLGLPGNPVVVYVDSFSYDGRNRGMELPSLRTALCADIMGRGHSLAEARRALLRRYGIPRLSLREALWPSAQCPPTMGSRLWTCSDTCHHPTAPTHRLIAKWMESLVKGSEQELNRDHCTLDAGNSAPEITLVPGAAEIEVGADCSSLTHKIDMILYSSDAGLLCVFPENVPQGLEL